MTVPGGSSVVGSGSGRVAISVPVIEGILVGSGVAGPSGPHGPDGPKGDPGPKGDKGDKGDPGTTTFAGLTDVPAVGRAVVMAADARAARMQLAAVGVVPPPGAAAANKSAIEAFLAAEKLARVEGGVYPIPKSGVSVPAVGGVVVAAGSALKLADGELNSTFAAGVATRVVDLHDGSSFVGAVDANRGGQDKTLHNTSTTGTSRQFNYGIHADGSAAAPLRNLYVDATVTGAVEFAGYFNYVEDSFIRLRVSDSGGAIVLSNCKNVVIDVVADRIDPAGWACSAMGGLITNCTDINGRFVNLNQAGKTGGIAAGGNPPWNVGLTIQSSQGIQLDEVNCQFIDDDTHLRGIGCSIVSSRDVHIDRLRLVGYSDGLLELGGVTHSTFGQLDLDQRYRMYPGKSGHMGYGIHLKNNSFRPNYKSQSGEYTRDVTFVGGTVRRCTGEAVLFRNSADTTWLGVKVQSSWKGVAFDNENHWADPGLTVAPTTPFPALSGHVFIGCDFSWHERSGVDIMDAENLRFVSCTSNNNSQGFAFGTCRLGLSGGPATGGVWSQAKSPKTGLVLDIDTDDTQGWTAPGFIDPARPTKICVDNPQRYAANQTLTIKGAGPAGADLLVRVNDVDRDEITVDRPLSTFPTATLKGSISTSGTTVTGVGTEFTKDFTGTAYVKVGTDVRRVLVVTDDLHAKLESAFPADAPAGTAVTIYRADVVSVHSQRYGFNLSADTVEPVLPARVPTGNVLGAYLDASTKPRRNAVMVPAPKSATDAGLAGQIAYDAGHVYVCTAANTWVRASTATW